MSLISCRMISSPRELDGFKGALVKHHGGNCEVRRTKTIDWCLTIKPSFTFIILLRTFLFHRINYFILLVQSFDTEDPWKLEQLRYTVFPPTNLTALNGTYKLGIVLAGEEGQWEDTQERVMSHCKRHPVLFVYSIPELNVSNQIAYLILCARIRHQSPRSWPVFGTFLARVLYK